MSYRATHQQSISQPDEFWLRETRKISWYRFPQTARRAERNGHDSWFPDGEINLSYLCLDYHLLAGRGQETALIYDSPVSGTCRKYTFSELKTLVAKFAGGLSSKGVKKGDTVIIYMPMIPQAMIAMLACARIGAIHSVVFGGFAPHELALRIQDCRPKAIITATFGMEG